MSEATPALETPRAVLRETSIAFGVVTVLAWALTRISAPPFEEYVPLAIAALLLLTAVELAQRRPGGLAAHGLSLAGLLEPASEASRGLGAATELLHALRRTLRPALREAGVGLLIAAVIFPPFVWGFGLWHAPTRAFALAWPDDPLGYLASQLVVIGLPEEAFFRGYLQSRLAKVFSARTRLLGVTLSLGALLAQAALFALIHFVVDLDPQRLAVFFPGLLFGWLRAWRGGIGAAITLHALSNLLSDVLARSWL